ncbi:universal stress protein [Parapontixanthobacter aurantiacus]|uniref:universal stress protein n=1 Tax=Parapontixanthobacter aurantiacus TaxID=1463599 RepID=UPI00136F6457
MSAPILVATDFSARADRALDRALLLGKERNCTVRVIHALDFIDAENADWNDLENRMAQTVGDAPCPIETAFPEGSPPRAIAEETRGPGVELLVIGPARYNSIGDYFLGTAVDYVLRDTDCPCLVVKKRARTPYGHIVAGTDFSAASAYAIIEAAKLFPDVPVHIVHAWQVPFQAFQHDRYVAEEIEADESERLVKFVDDLKSRAPNLKNTTHRLVRGGVHEALTSESQAHDNDPASTLVVVGSHGTSGFRQAALGSVTSELLRTLSSDILVVNTKKADS